MGNNRLLSVSRRQRLTRRLNRIGSSREQRAELDRIGDLDSANELRATVAAAERHQGDAVWADKVASAVTWRLTALGTPEAEAALIEMLAHPLVEVRLAAANRLAEQPPAHSLREFERLLDDPDEQIRIAAIVAISQARHEPARPRVEELAHAGARLERHVAKKALRTIAQ